MKTWITVLCAVAVALVVLAGAEKKDAPKVVTEAPKVVVDEDQLERRDGLWYFEGKPFTGVAVWKHENGKKEKEITIKDGKPDGLWTWWHENGQKKAEANYKDGKPADGLYTLWHENGQKKYEATFKDGKQISTKKWDQDGKLTEE